MTQRFGRDRRIVSEGWPLVGIASVLVGNGPVVAVVFAVTGVGEPGIRACAIPRHGGDLARALPRGLRRLAGERARPLAVDEVAPAEPAVATSASPSPLRSSCTRCSSRRSRPPVPGVVLGEDPPDDAGRCGSFGYVLLVLMTITSFDRTATWLGRKAWSRLHTTGMYVFWVIFATRATPVARRGRRGLTEGRSGCWW